MMTGQKEVTQKRNRTTVNSVLLNILTSHIISEEKSQNKKFFVFFTVAFILFRRIGT